jgi:hypothetical protein
MVWCFAFHTFIHLTVIDVDLGMKGNPLKSTIVTEISKPVILADI